MLTLRRWLIGFSSFWLVAVILIGLPVAALTRTITDPSGVTEIASSETIYSQLRTAADDLPLNQIDGAEAESTVDARIFFDATTYRPLLDQYFHYIGTVRRSPVWLAVSTAG